MLLSMDQLTRFFETYGAKSDDHMPVIDIKYVHLWDDSPADEEHPLYIITASDLNKLSFTDDGCDRVFVVQEDKAVSKDLLKQRGLHIVRIPKKYSLKQIANTANQLFLQTNNALDHYDKLLFAVSKPNNYTEMAKTISDLTKCPVALIAGTSQIISSCEHDLEKKDWDNYLSHRLLKLIQIPDRLIYERFYIEPLKAPLGEYEYEVFFPITSDDPSRQINGIIYLLCSDPIVPASWSNVLHFTSYTMSWFFTRYANKDNAIKLQNQMMNFMLMDLLHGIIPSEDTLKRVLGNLSFKTDRELVLICVRTSLSEGSDNFDEAKRVFMSFFEDSFSFTQSADIYILTSPNWLLPKNKSVQKKFTALLKENGCYAGISSSFYSIDKFFIHHFSRALAAADVAIQIKEKQRWTDFRAVSLLAIQSNNYASAIHFCDPALINLVEYDKAHVSDNLYTLCCYWQLNRDIGRICKFLHIHKNTLYYRLRKIASILRQDINDYDNFIQLSLSIAILENLGSIPRYRIFDDDRRMSKWSIQEEYTED